MTWSVFRRGSYSSTIRMLASCPSSSLNATTRSCWNRRVLARTPLYPLMRLRKRSHSPSVNDRSLRDSIRERKLAMRASSLVISGSYRIPFRSSWVMRASSICASVWYAALAFLLFGTLRHTVGTGARAMLFRTVVSMQPVPSADAVAIVLPFLSLSPASMVSLFPVSFSIRMPVRPISVSCRSV